MAVAERTINAEVDEMKNAKSRLVAVLLGSIAPISPVLAADYVISKEEVTPGHYYCHRVS